MSVLDAGGAALAERPGEALLALYRQPPLSALRPPAFGAPEGPALSAAELLKPEVLEGLLVRYARTFGEGADWKAAVSLWSKHHFGLLSIPALVANLLLGRELPVAPDRMRVELGDRSQTDRLWIAGGDWSPASRVTARRFAALLDGHCAPLIETLASLSGLSARVFWGNLGHCAEYVGKACSRHPSSPGAGEPLLDFLEMRLLPDGRRNPLYRPVCYLALGEEALSRVRHLCCRESPLSDESPCGDCPLNPGNRPVGPRE